MSSRILRQYIAALKSAGIRYIPRVELPEPAAVRPGANLAARRKEAVRTGKPAPSKPVGTAAASVPVNRSVSQSEKDAALAGVVDDFQTQKCNADDALQLVSQIVSKCQRCQELAEQRRQTVFGTGDPNARIMFVGEAPGADEDRQGEPFVGAAGQLLNKIIAACGLTREEIYICNILRCRPPGNRNPLPQEASNCREYLDAQIAIVQPEYIVCWGTIAAQNLLNEQRSVGKLRGSFLKHGDAKVLCTYHPSYLLRYPQQKKEVWADMKILMADMGVEL